MPSLLRTARVRRLTTPIRSRLGAAVARVARREVERLRQDVATVEELGREVAELRTALDATNTQLDMARRVLDDIAKFHEDSATTMTVVENRTRELSAVVDSLRCSVESILGPTGRYTSRLLADDEFDVLMNDFDFVDDRSSVAVSLHIAYRTLVDLELRCVGRFDGSTPNILAKLAAVMLLPQPSGEVLEIGTLFGVDAVGLARQVARTGAAARLTIVDPFDGHQVEPNRGADRDVSLSPATKSVVATNLALGGVDERHYRLIDGRSDDPEVQRAASDRRYGLIVIDGDHSREAALNDLIWVESVAEPGGLVVLDDFGDPAWPGVAEALQRYLDRPDSTLRMLGSAATSAFLKADGSSRAG